MKETLVGAVAYDPKIVTIWELLRDITRARGFPMDYVLFSSYEALVRALLDRRVDVAWNTNTAYVRILLATGGACRPLVMRDTDVGYRTKLIARAGSGMATLQDLRGRTVAFGSRDSGHAAILPAYYLRRAGLNPDRDLRPLRFDLDVGKHGDTGASETEVLRAVQAGEANAGFVGDPWWLRSLQLGMVDGNRVQAVWTSPPYNHCNFTVLADYPQEAAEAFTRAFLAMDPADPQVRRMMDLEGLNRWLPGRAEGYEDLLAAMRE